MPNYVYNKLVIHGGFSDLDIFSDGSLDFNKITPMPQPLRDSIAGGYDSVGLCLLWMQASKEHKEEINILDNIVKEKKIFDAYISLSPYHSDIRDEMGRANELTEEKKLAALKEGEKCYKNFIKYGHCNWYTWRVDNWSVKWNCSDVTIIDPETIFFTTAWNMPEKIIQKISKMIPDREITISWTDEGRASNTGLCTFLNGELIEGGYLEPFTESWEDVVHSLCLGE